MLWASLSLQLPEAGSGPQGMDHSIIALFWSFPLKHLAPATVTRQDMGLDGPLVCPSMAVLMFLTTSSRGCSEEMCVHSPCRGTQGGACT